MAAMTLPFMSKSNAPGVTVALLILVSVAIGVVAWLVFRHLHARDKARKAGVSHRHDGRHGNH